MSPIRELIDPKIVRVISLLMRHKKEYFHLQKISEKTGVPISTTFRIVNKLVKIGFIDTTKVGKLKIYRISGNPKTEKLRRTLFER